MRSGDAWFLAGLGLSALAVWYVARLLAALWRWACGLVGA